MKKGGTRVDPAPAKFVVGTTYFVFAEVLSVSWL